jgi:alpha-L-fucosidase
MEYAPPQLERSQHGADKTGPMAGVPYDGADSAYQELYHPKHNEPMYGAPNLYATNPGWHETWFKRISDLIDNYHPDLLYSDGGIPFGVVGRTLLANYYNGNMAAHAAALKIALSAPLKNLSADKERECGVDCPCRDFWLYPGCTSSAVENRQEPSPAKPTWE